MSILLLKFCEFGFFDYLYFDKIYIFMEPRFVKSIRGTDSIMNDGHSQVVFIGRSNVGKSSVINSLLGTRKLVRSSSIPGQTRLINFFAISERFYFVDLPGYGYAKISFREREDIMKMISWYLEESGADIETVVLVIDARVGLRDVDLEVLEHMREKRYHSIVVANKEDRLNQSEKYEMRKKIQAKLNQEDFIFYSAKTGRGKEKLWKGISSC